MAFVGRTARATVNVDTTEIVATLSRIENGFRRGRILIDALRDALEPIAADARELAPQPGKPGYTPRRGQRRTRKMLKDTIGVVTALVDGGSRGATLFGLVGPQYPAGASAHLVELGHRMAAGGSLKRIRNINYKKLSQPKSKRGLTGMGKVVGFVRPRPFMRPAFERHEERIESRMAEAVDRMIAEASP